MIWLLQICNKLMNVCFSEHYKCKHPKWPWITETWIYLSYDTYFWFQILWYDKMMHVLLWNDEPTLASKTHCSLLHITYCYANGSHMEKKRFFPILLKSPCKKFFYIQIEYTSAKTTQYSILHIQQKFAQICHRIKRESCWHKSNSFQLPVASCHVNCTKGWLVGWSQRLSLLFVLDRYKIEKNMNKTMPICVSNAFWIQTKFPKGSISNHRTMPAYM